MSPVTLIEHMLPAMEEGGVIVNVSSGYGQLNELSSKYRAKVQKAETLAALREIEFDPTDSMMSSSYVAPYKVSKAMLNKATLILSQRPEVRMYCARAPAMF